MADRQVTRWIQRRPLLGALLWTVVPSGIALLLAPLIPKPELVKVIYTGAATLFFGGFLGGMLKLLLDELVAVKRRREDAAGFVTNVLADLKSVYDRVARARIVIPAHKSAKTYDEEMLGLIEARVQLRNVIRALERRSDGIEEAAREKIKRRVKEMEKYLETLTTEFRDNYKPLSDKQRGYEARAVAMVADFAKEKTEGNPPFLPDFVWKSIATLPVLLDFIRDIGDIGDGSSYKSNFEDPLDVSSELLRAELARIIGAPGGTWEALR
jgi:hypothetical protein